MDQREKKDSENKEEVRSELILFHDWLVKENRVQFNGKNTKMNIVDHYLAQVKEQKEKLYNLNN